MSAGRWATTTTTTTKVRAPSEAAILEVRPKLGMRRARNMTSLTGTSGFVSGLELVVSDDATPHNGTTCPASLMCGASYSTVHQELRGYCVVAPSRGGYIHLREGYHFRITRTLSACDDIGLSANLVELRIDALGIVVAVEAETRKYNHHFVQPPHHGPVDLEALATDFARRQPTWFDAVRSRDIPPYQLSDSPRLVRVLRRLEKDHHIDAATYGQVASSYYRAEYEAKCRAVLRKTSHRLKRK